MDNIKELVEGLREISGSPIDDRFVRRVCDEAADVLEAQAAKNERLVRERDAMVALPVSIGQTVYGFAYPSRYISIVLEETVLSITLREGGTGWFETDADEYRFGGRHGQIGKTVFLTREEAEKALETREGAAHE